MLIQFVILFPFNLFFAVRILVNVALFYGFTQRQGSKAIYLLRDTTHIQKAHQHERLIVRLIGRHGVMTATRNDSSNRFDAVSPDQSEN